MPPKRTKHKSANDNKRNKITKEIINKEPRAQLSPKSKSDKLSKYAKVHKMDKAEKILAAKQIKIDTTLEKSPQSPDFQANPINVTTKMAAEANKPETEQLNNPKPNTTKKIRIEDLSADDSLKRAIAEIESEGSSTESVDYDQYYYLHSQEEEEEEYDYIINDPEKLVLPAIISEDESSIDEEHEYVKETELETELDFFDNFADVPQVDELSIDSTVDLNFNIPIEIEKIEPVVDLDIGNFVNPLTGISTPSLTTKSSKEETEEMEEELQHLKEEELQHLAKEDEEEQKLSVVSDDVLSIIELIEEPEQYLTEDLTKPRDENEADTFEQFLELKTEEIIITQADLDMEDKIREELDRQNFQCAMEFIDELIDRCVDRAEYLDSNVLLRQNLDKRKLLQDLKLKLSSLTVEQSVKQFLNRKCVEHFRRKRVFRPIMNDNPKTINQDIEKFYTAASDLDKWLIKEEQLKISSNTNLEILRANVTAAKEQAFEEIKKFENLLRDSFKRDNFDKLQMVVNNCIHKMSLVRKEISKIRFRLILKQHKEALLVEQLRDLEDLGNGLSMRNFENMQTETQALGKKIEERNAELKKQHFRCNADIHSMAHLKEKQKMLNHTISVQKKYLEECLIDKEKLRDTIHQLKLNRNRIRYEIRDLSFQGGLLDKPLLMRDFDKTVESVEKLKRKVDSLKSTINRLNTKIAVLKEQNCKRIL